MFIIKFIENKNDEKLYAECFFSIPSHYLFIMISNGKEINQLTFNIKWNYHKLVTDGNNIKTNFFQKYGVKLKQKLVIKYQNVKCPYTHYYI